MLVKLEITPHKHCFTRAIEVQTALLREEKKKKKRQTLASCYVSCYLSKVQQQRATMKQARVFNETATGK